jgi:hypothetical protein
MKKVKAAKKRSMKKIFTLSRVIKSVKRFLRKAKVRRLFRYRIRLAIVQI